ncbi:hypothetical protein BDZ89DRAFT_1016517 [Hymenopellis radicata]|nr:hypothetical protein BDZ89DRAFT_1016517 [Hymenopellis radicata]
MDSSNPQHYQPLSHALRLPVGANATVSPSNTYIRKPARREEEEDEDAEEDVVEQQLSRDQLSRPSSPAEKTPSNPDVQQQPIIHQYEPDQKRRPGRPRGSKNRKRESQPPTKPVVQDQPVPPQNPGVNAQNKQYYEFQWRVLNLCGEFYRAAEELVKDTNPLIIAQCYATAESTVDPLVMLKDAKRVCDNLIANPSRLIANPPPPMYPVIPTLYQPPGGQPAASTSTAPPTVINQPQSFVVSMGAPPPTQYPVYATPYQPPYYPHYPGYPPPPPGTVYYQQPPPPQPTVQPPTTHQPTPTPTPPSYALVHTTTISNAAGNQGSWSDAEIERLKSLVDESKANNPTGDLNWDWVVTQFGNDRTRHQILIKATSLGLKESSTRQVPSRGTKRRRDGDGSATPPPAPPSTSPSGANTNTTPTESQGPATPAASPTMHKPPHSASAPKSTPTPNLPWPMPTVAVNTTSPVMTPSSVDRSSSYYRPRPSESSKPIMGPSHGHIQHQFMYHPNSNGGPGK